MAKDDHTYVIEPGTTDPTLVKSLTALGDDAGQPVKRTEPRKRRPIPTAPPTPTIVPVRRPLRWLIGAFLLGPFSILMPTGHGRRLRIALAAVAVLLPAAAVWIWWQEPHLLGGGDRAILIQAAAAALATATVIGVWCLGLIWAARRCPEGPLARRGDRRPLLAGLAGLTAPGLGLYLAGRQVRCAITLALVGLGAAAGLALTRAASWWSWHHDQPPALVNDVDLERAYLILAGLVVLGSLAWLASALEAGRLAGGPRTVRAAATVDRVPLALVIALVALGVLFRPLDVARELDRISGGMAASDLRLIPLWTARAAAALAPADPALALRVADRHEDLGDAVAAATIRTRIHEQWQGIQDTAPAVTVDVMADAAEPAPTTTRRSPGPPADPRPFSPPVATAELTAPAPPAP